MKMKYKYLTLTKEEKQKAKVEFYQTDAGLNLKKRFSRLLSYSILLILFGILIIVTAYINNESIASYIFGITLFIFSLVFLIGRYKLFLIHINNFIIAQKK